MMCGGIFILYSKTNVYSVYSMKWWWYGYQITYQYVASYQVCISYLRGGENFTVQ